MNAPRGNEHHEMTHTLLQLLQEQGGARYGGEAVSQRQHALQTAWFAEQEGAGALLISAALLHDVGHLLHALPDDAADQGLDDRHQYLAGSWLEKYFPPAVVDPVRMHVEAKRYLCAVDSRYLAQLSPASRQSLVLQGGPLQGEELEEFRARPHFEQSIRLRRWDDAAKVVGLATPDLHHFAQYLDLALREGPSCPQ